MNLLALPFLNLLLFFGSSEAHWPTWRGPDFNGAAPDSKPPVTWSETHNLLWKTPVAGLGLATPVIWGERLFLLTAVKTERAAEKAAETRPELGWANPIAASRYYRYQVMALDRNAGKILWTRTAVEKIPHETTHGNASWASCSPVTDGEHLIASFGSAGIFCYDMDGNLQWQTDLGDMRTRRGFGEGSSPALYGDSVIINWDHEDQSFIVALDKKTGKQIWKKDREEVTSWSTPAVAVVGGKPRVIVSATNRVRAYDLATGEEIWQCGGMTLNTIPSPIVDGHMAYLASGYRGSALLALNLEGAEGDISGSSRVVWQHDRDTPYVPSILLYEGDLYVIKHNRGILTVLDAKTGKPHYGPQRLDDIEGIYASPVGAGGHVYLLDRAGVAMVIKSGPEFRVVAVNKLDDYFDASPAVAGNKLYLRGHKHLYCIAE